MSRRPFIKRPASSLDSEPFVPLPEDILCPGSDDEKTAQQHRDKRRRIEALAEQYLQGQQLFILSASLRGPLNKGWVNPWVRKRRGNETPAEATSGLACETPSQWLLAGSVFRREREKVGLRTPSPPTPTKLQDQEPPIFSTRYRPPSNMQPKSQAAPTVPRQSLPNDVHYVGFTPVNKRDPPQHTEISEAHGQPGPIKPSEAKVDCEDVSYASKVAVRETTLDKADEAIRQGLYRAKQLSQEAVDQAIMNDGHIEARNISERAASRALEGSLRVDLSRVTSPGSNHLFGNDGLPLPTQSFYSRAFENTQQALPPSTNLPAFAYHYARKRNTLPPKGPSSFAETLELAKAKAEIAEIAEVVDAKMEANKKVETKAKAKAQEQEIRRLSFTASGTVKNSKSISREWPQHHTSSSLQQRRTSLDQKQSVQASFSTVEDKIVAKNTDSGLMNGALSCGNDYQPEAQIVPPIPIVSGLVPSGPSTDLLETDQQSQYPQGIEEGDSYADLSTQAAIVKAHRSFQNAALSPVKSSPRQCKKATTSVVSPTTPKTTKAAKATNTTHEPSEPFPYSPIFPTSPSLDDDPMDTQAMINAMSPFAMTTIKKKRADTNVALSPITPTANGFPALSSPPAYYTYPTSPTSPPPTHSRPPSFGLMSSIAPKSTDAYLQDGQQQQQPQQRYYDSSGWDLDAAIEEAGQFLETWDVENEARKEGERGSGSGTSKGKGEGSRGGSMGERMRKETRMGMVEG